MKTLIATLSICCAGLLFTARANADGAINKDWFSDQRTKSLVDKLESDTDHFRDKLKDGVKTSSIKGTDLEDRLKHWAGFLEDQTDRMGDAFHDKQVSAFDQRLNNSLMAAAALNSAVVRRGFGTEVEVQWGTIRDDLNGIASRFGKRALPGLTLLFYPPVPAVALTRAEVKLVMEELESATDRFKDTVDSYWITTLGTEEREPFKQWTANLEDTTDKLLHEYKDSRYPEFQFRLEQSLMEASGLNQVILAKGAGGAPSLPWDRIRDELNELARQFGYAPIQR